MKTVTQTLKSLDAHHASEILHCSGIALSLALYDLNAGSLVAIMGYDTQTEKDKLIHTAVSTKNGFINSKGLRTKEELLRDKHCWDPKIKRITRRDLIKLGGNTFGIDALGDHSNCAQLAANRILNKINAENSTSTSPPPINKPIKLRFPYG